MFRLVNVNIIQLIFTFTIHISIFPKSVKQKIQTLHFNLFANKVKLAHVFIGVN